MSHTSRIQNTLKNARVGALCYFTSLLVSFFSRRIFLEHLGTDFVGFTSTLASIIGFLNIAEFGVGSAVSMVLFKPLYDNDRQETSQITSILGYLYRKVGLFILAAGLVTSILLPFFYHNYFFPKALIFIGFFSYLFVALLGYFVNYGSILLSADQKNYVVTGLFQITCSVKVVAQCLITVYYCNLYIFFIIEIFFAIVYCVLLNKKLYSTYPWLDTSVLQGKSMIARYPQIRKKLKQTLVHQVGGFVQNQSAPLFIFGFVSLPMVAMYNNYTLVTGSIRTLLFNTLQGCSASIGNLIAEGNSEKIYQSYKQLLSMRFVCAGIAASCVYLLLPSFVSLWVGSQYMLAETILVLVCVHLILLILREATDQFLQGYGLVQDVWSPVIETIIYICASCFGGYFWGLEGILFGSITSLVLVIYTWKPYFLFTKGFKVSVFRYWFFFVNQMMLAALSFFLSFCAIQEFDCTGDITWQNWICRALIYVLVVSGSFLLIFSSFSRSFRSFVRRFF